MRAVALLSLAGCSFTHGALPSDGGPPGEAGHIDAAIDARADAHVCPVGFMSLVEAPPTSAYLTFSAQSYTTAVATCSQLGTHLVRLDTQGEANAVDTLIDQVTTGSDTHLYRVVGQRDRTVVPNRWLDLDNTTPLTFLPWGAGEPTSLTGEECILLRLEGATSVKVIGADQCTTSHEFACECE